jgi:DNA-binding beta-propeller fold protein YncE
MVGGVRPYSLEISSSGDVAVFSNQGGGQGDIDVINIIDLKAKPPRIVDTISVGQTPEGIGMSGDGKYVAVTVMNGSNRPKAHPAFNDYGLLQIYSVKGTTLRKVAEAKVGHWCQGAAFSKNNKTVVIQCMVEKNLQVFNFDGHKLKPAGTVPLSGGGAGLRTAAR